MKDSYSFNIDEACLEETYLTMRNTYKKVLERMGLEYKIVSADSGAIGGDASEEFHVLAETGEDTIAVSNSSCLLYTSPSPRDRQKSRMPSSA